MKLEEMIVAFKHKTGMSDSDIARHLGVSRSTVKRWGNGEIKKVSIDTAKKLSQLLGYNIEPVLQGMDISVKVPVLGYVKAGYDLFAEENYIGEEEVSLADIRRGDFYLKVTGDSMNGIGILDGSLVLVQKCDMLTSGQIGVVLIGEEVTVKRVVYKENMMILEAANPEVKNRYFTAKEVKNIPIRIIGKVISCKTYFG